MSIGVTGAYAAYNVYQAAAKDFNYRAAHNGENMDPTALDSLEKTAISRKSGETLKMAKDFVNVKDDKNENSKVDSFVRSRPEEKGGLNAAKAEKKDDGKENTVEKHMERVQSGEKDRMEKHLEVMAEKAKANREAKAGDGEKMRKAAAHRISNAARADKDERASQVKAERRAEQKVEHKENKSENKAHTVAAEARKTDERISDSRQNDRAAQLRNRFSQTERKPAERMSREA